MINETLTSNNATHYLQCSHVCGGNERHFKMRCHVIKNMGDGRLKILVFGRMWWSDFDLHKKIRYVESHRVISLE